jgi:PIN domain nuclease of toxin-antitoxin system
VIHLDTHVVMWLYVEAADRLPAVLQRRLDAEPVRVSPMVEIELAVLHEIGRVTDPPAAVLTTLRSDIALEIDDTPFGAVSAAAVRLAWTRDPFDRVIVAQAIAAGVDLATKDRGIRKEFPRSVWD